MEKNDEELKEQQKVQSVRRNLMKEEKKLRTPKDLEIRHDREIKAFKEKTKKRCWWTILLTELPPLFTHDIKILINHLMNKNVFRCTLVNTWDLTAISLQSLEVIICVSQQFFVSWRLILRCTGRSCISDRHTDTVWNDLQVSACRVSWKAVWLHEEHAWLSGRLRFPTSPGSFCCSFQAFFGLCVVPC